MKLKQTTVLGFCKTTYERVFSFLTHKRDCVVEGLDCLKGREGSSLQKMSWLFGSEVDLSSAERAIDQLSKDRDASQDKVTKLQEQAQQQKRRIEDWQRKMEAALNTDEQVWSVRMSNHPSAVIGFHVCLCVSVYDEIRRSEYSKRFVVLISVKASPMYTEHEHINTYVQAQKTLDNAKLALQQKSSEIGTYIYTCIYACLYVSIQN